MKRIRTEATVHQAHELCLDVLDTTLHVLDRAGDTAGAADLVRSLGQDEPFAAPIAQCKALSIQTMAFLYGEVEKGLEAGRKAVALARHADLDGARLQALHRLLLGLLLSGRLESDEGRRIVAESLECAGSSGDMVSHALVLSNLASWHLSVADWEAAGGFLDKLHRRIEATDSPFLRFLYHANRGALWLELGEASNALEELTRADGAGNTVVSPHQYQQFRAVQAMAFLEVGRLGDAMEAAQDFDLPRTWSGDASELFLFHARLQSRVGRPMRSVELLERGMCLARPSMPVAWLRMAYEFVMLRRRMGRSSTDLAGEAIRLAGDLRLPYLSERFRPYAT